MTIDTIFIIPYRDREEHKKKFISHMNEYLEQINFTGNYIFVFSHQCDKRPFNRGAMKNIGFLAMKKMFLDTYKDITFIFHDVDTLPSNECFIPYKTTKGKVAHYYGFKYALGGMFAIKGIDFEMTNGFPNFWGWGLEDNVIYERCLNNNIEIDRSIFFDITDKKNITHLFSGINRIISKRDSVVYKSETPDSMNDIKNLKWDIENDDDNNILYVNTTNFDVNMNPNEQVYENFDIRSGSKIIVPKGYNRRIWKLY